jgi:hypothetical protein
MSRTRYDAGGLVYYCQEPHKPSDANPGVWSVFMAFVGFAHAEAKLNPDITSIEIIVTSVFRPDGTHASRDCIDFDIFINGKPSEETYAGKAFMIRAKAFIDYTYPYGLGYDGEAHHTFVWWTDDAHRNHVHLQHRGA